VKRVVVLNRNELVSAFMENVLSAEGAFRAGHGIGLAQVDDNGTGLLIAAVWFDSYNGANVNMHVAAIPGKRWMTREFLYFVFSYPFNQLGVRRITGLVAEDNAAARKFDEHIGFTLEARLKDAAVNGDLLVYCMFKHQCRWLNLRQRYAKE